MILRIWTTGVDESRADEYERFAATRSLPMFAARPGFIDVTLARSPGRRMVLTRWRDEASADALATSPSYRETVAAIEAAGFLHPPQSVELWHLP